MKKDYKELLKKAKPSEVQSICDEMIKKGIEVEDVADAEKDKDIYNKIAMHWKPNF